MIFIGLNLMTSQEGVTPVKTGVKKALKRLDSGFRRNDVDRWLWTFYMPSKDRG